MSGTVSRVKYSTIKRKAKKWRIKALDAMNEAEHLQLEVERLEELLEKNTYNPELVKKLRTENEEIKLENEKVLCRQNNENYEFKIICSCCRNSWFARYCFGLCFKMAHFTE